MLKQQLQNMVDVRKLANIEHPTGFLYNSIEEFVLKYGSQWKYGENKWCRRPYKKGIPRHCFYNAAKLVRRSSRLTYVEGYAASANIPIPILHAWAIHDADGLVDVTCPSFTEYVGVRFTKVYLFQHEPGISLLDNYREHYPLLRCNNLKDIVENFSG